MGFTGRQRILLETNVARDKAEALLAGLLNAQRAVDVQEPRFARHGQLVSRASMDRAISSTKNLIAALNDAIARAEVDLHDDDLAILDEVDEDGNSIDITGLSHKDDDLDDSPRVPDNSGDSAAGNTPDSPNSENPGGNPRA